MNAYEVMLDRAAADDAERSRNRSQRYRPPDGAKPKLGGRRPPGRMDAGQAARLAAEMADEDAKLGRGRKID